MTAHGFHVDPPALDGLARDVTRAADELAPQIGRLLAKTAQIEDGFGVLTESDEVLESYRENRADVAQSLRLLVEHLKTTSEGLTVTATSYGRSDTDGERRLGGLR